MKKFRFINTLIAVIALCMLSGCMSDKADKLLSTIPSDAVAVATFNVAKIAENAGCTANGSKITLSPAIKSQMKGEGNDAFIKMLENGDLGVKFEAMAFFVTKDGLNYLTAEIENQEKFVKAAKEASDGDMEFEQQGDFMVARDLVVGKEQMWLCSRRADVEKIRAFTTLTSDNSILSTPMSSNLSDMDHAANLALNISEGLDAMRMMGGSGSQISGMRLVLNSIYEKATYICGHADLDGKELEIEAKVLNREGSPARFLLDMGEINGTSIKALQTSSNVVAAMAVNQAIMDQLVQMLAGPAGLPDMTIDALKSVDGTVAIALNDDKKLKLGIDCKEVTPIVKEMANLWANDVRGEATVGGNRVFITTPMLPSGPVTAADAADDLKGAMFGVSFSTNGIDPRTPDMRGVVKIEKSGDSAKLKAELTTPKKFLEYLIEFSCR